MARRYVERVVAFGPNKILSGVLTFPPPRPKKGEGIWFIIPNAGIIPRVGVSRLHVRLARRLADCGIGTLRFDLSGIGDSDRPLDVKHPADMAQTDLAAAERHLKDTLGSAGVCIVGLCSGAHDAVRFAREAANGVFGIVTIDLVGEFRNTKHLVRHYAKRLRKWESWKKATASPVTTLTNLGKRLGRQEISREREPGAEPRVGARSRVSHDQVRNDLALLSERNVDMFFFFTGDLEENYSYEHQFRDAFPAEVASPNVTYKYLREAGHVLPNRQHQDDVCELVATWAQERFAGWLSRVAPPPT